MPNGFVSHDNPAFGHHLFDISVAQAEAKVQPDAVADDLGREPATVTTRVSIGPCGIMSHGLFNLTMPSRQLGVFDTESAGRIGLSALVQFPLWGPSLFPMM